MDSKLVRAPLPETEEEDASEKCPQVELPRLLESSFQEYPDDPSFDQYLQEIGFWEIHKVDESWMEVKPEDLEEMLRARYGSSEEKPKKPEEEGQQEADAAEFDLQKVLQTFTEFLGRKSGAEGVELDDEYVFPYGVCSFIVIILL